MDAESSPLLLCATLRIYQVDGWMDGWMKCGERRAALLCFFSFLLSCLKLLLCFIFPLGVRRRRRAMVLSCSARRATSLPPPPPPPGPIFLNFSFWHVLLLLFTLGRQLNFLSTKSFDFIFFFLFIAIHRVCCLAGKIVSSLVVSALFINKRESSGWMVDGGWGGGCALIYRLFLPLLKITCRVCVCRQCNKRPFRFIPLSSTRLRIYIYPTPVTTRGGISV